MENGKYVDLLSILENYLKKVERLNKEYEKLNKK